jgi:hypothetical protein
MITTAGITVITIMTITTDGAITEGTVAAGIITDRYRKPSR